ncbi:hypothetical protein GQ42DRAFT_56606 [Ramicandelaber brevisporus]|nr:hypothetical protein GQ42DRAFT_56606 [Ramicandelaber brevisporus]
MQIPMLRSSFRSLIQTRPSLTRSHSNSSNNSSNSTSNNSTVAIGRRYERFVAKTLASHLGMALQPCGGAYDRGVDFRGTWVFPSSSHKADMATKDVDTVDAIQILGQCKRYSTDRRIGPMLIREWEAAIRAASATVFTPTGQYPEMKLRKTLGIFASTTSLSERAVLTAKASPMAMMITQIREYHRDIRREDEEKGEEKEEVAGVIEKLWWNNAATSLLQHLAVAQPTARSNRDSLASVIVSFKGKPLNKLITQNSELLLNQQ